MRKVRKLAVIFTVFLIFGMGLALWSYHRAPVKAVEIRLVQATNQGSVAFAISNCTKRSIGLLRAEPQWLQHSEWPKSLGQNRVYLGSIAAHQQRAFLVAVPATGEPWRLPIVWGFTPTQLDFWTAVLRDNCRAALSQRELPGFGVNIVMHTNYSEVQQPRSMKHENNDSGG